MMATVVPATVRQLEGRLAWKNPSPLIPGRLFGGRGLTFAGPWKLACRTKVESIVIAVRIHLVTAVMLC